MAELGPFLIPNHSDTPVLNPNSWNKNAHLLFIDQPVGVGFSNGMKREWPRVAADYAKDALEFFVKFYAVYPQFAGKDLYIFGESYGGHYIPAIAKALVDSGNPDILLKGIGIGNGFYKGGV